MFSTRTSSLLGVRVEKEGESRRSASWKEGELRRSAS